METKKYFLHLLSSYINGKVPSEPNASVDWEKLMHMASSHAVQPMIFLTVNKLHQKPSIYEDLKKSFYICVKVSVMQEVAMEEVIKCLNENHIDHMLMKGYILRNYYPDKEARTFGDIDFLIDEKDREKSDIAIKSLGFKYDEHYKNDVWTYHKDVITIEVHTNIIYDDLFNDIDYTTYFREKTKNKILIRENTYEMTKEDHFIYIIVHLAKHFFNSGIGVRMLIDVAVFINNFKDVLDFNYIHNEMDKIKLHDFFDNVCFLCKKYLDTDIDCSLMDEEKEAMVMEYVLNHGVFGYENKDVESIKYHKNNECFAKIIFKTLFPSYKVMRLQYPWFKDMPKFMLPYGWVRRLLFQITDKNRRKSIRSKLNMAVNISDDAEVHNKILDMVGISKNRWC